MLQPYAPGKIPVVFVHGLAASPMAFLQAINDFQNDPALSARYQFWVFIYPTGATIVLGSAVPRGVGPGRGCVRGRPGVLSDGRGRAQHGGHPCSHGRLGLRPAGRGRPSNVSPERLRASPATPARPRPVHVLPSPAMRARRVVFIATPHRGSPLANSVVGRFYSGRICGRLRGRRSSPKSRR